MLFEFGPNFPRDEENLISLAIKNVLFVKILLKIQKPFQNIFGPKHRMLKAENFFSINYGISRAKRGIEWNPINAESDRCTAVF